MPENAMLQAAAIPLLRNTNAAEFCMDVWSKLQLTSLAEGAGAAFLGAALIALLAWPLATA